MLDPAHAELLRASAISDEVAEARGYFSAYTKAELGRLGFGRAQQLPPALVIPQWNVLGECAHHQLRPDQPRELKGRAVKYETPSRSTQTLDIPPGCRHLLDDPETPLIVTEGSRKADAAASRGMCAVSVNGVYGWRGTTGNGGKTALPDWEQIALNGRTVVLAFDSDAMTKREVHQALGRLVGFLQMRHARTLIAYLPADVSGRKVGLDDWLAAHPDAGYPQLEQLCRESLDPLEADADSYADVEDEPGWVVLGELEALVRRFVWFPDPDLAVAVALWITHTYLLDTFTFTPRLHVRSPMKRSGKSRLLEVIELLVCRPMTASLLTPAVVYRSIEATRPTLLVDEVDRLLAPGADEDRAALIAVLNLGFQPGKTIPRMVGTSAEMTVKHFPTYAAVAMAGIGVLPDTIADRCVTIRLERRPPGQFVEPFHLRDVRPDAYELGRRVAAWSFRHAEKLATVRPEMPSGLNDRAGDMWEVLFAIADAAGGTWPDRARACAVKLAGLHDIEDIDSTTELRLLRDIYETWGHVDRRFSTEIVEALNAIADAPWADRNRGAGLSTYQLAARLRGFGISSGTVRIGTETRKGYYELDFVEAWERYGVCQQEPPSPSAEASHPSQASHAWSEGGPVSRDVTDVTDVTDSRGPRDQVADDTDALDDDDWREVTP